MRNAAAKDDEKVVPILVNKKYGIPL